MCSTTPDIGDDFLPSENEKNKKIPEEDENEIIEEEENAQES